MTHDELREVAAEAVRKALIQPMCCMQGSGCEFPPCHCSTVAADAVLAAVWEALREPDAGMHEAGFAKSLAPMLGETEMPADFPNINGAIYRAMLAASPLRPAASAEGVG